MAMGLQLGKICWLGTDDLKQDLNNFIAWIWMMESRNLGTSVQPWCVLDFTPELGKA